MVEWVGKKEQRKVVNEKRNINTGKMAARTLWSSSTMPHSILFISNTNMLFAQTGLSLYKCVILILVLWIQLCYRP